MIVLDTDFFSSFFKIGKLEFILDVTGEKEMVIPETVYDELKRTSFFDKILYRIAFSEDDLSGERYILVKKVDLSICNNFIDPKEITELGKGELGCMVLAEEHGAEILISDRHARKTAKDKKLKAISIPTFLLRYKRQRKISVEEIKGIIKDLREKDFYEFSNEVEEELLR
jgi:predicted nucleic acid-binding protein